MAEMLRRTPDELETPAYAVVAADRPGGWEVRGWPLCLLPQRVATQRLAAQSAACAH